MTNPYAAAALPAFASAAIHVAVLPFAPGAETMGMLVGTILWVGLGYGLTRGSRLVASLAFLLGLFGGVYAFSGMMTYGGVSSILFGLMWLADWAVAFLLFGPLWRGRAQNA